MKKLISLLLSVLLSINFISYNPSVLYAEDVVSNDEVVEEIISDGSSEEIVLNDSKEELLSETDEAKTIVEEEDLETIVEEDVEEFEFINDYKDVEHPNLPKHDNNYIPKNAAVLDSYFNLQDQGYITSIKNQAQYGTCWAHALCASAESTYLMAHKDVSANSLDLSEVLLTYFVKENEFPDKLGLVTNDKSWDDSSYTNNLFDDGHNDYVAMFNVASGIGLSKESKYPYSEVTKLSSFNRSNFIKTINTEWCYDNDYYLINANVFDMSKETDKIKEYLKKYGAMAVSYYHSNNYEGTDGAYYYNGGTGTNHAVTLIGWDDNYSRNNFDGAVKPNTDGAWIIKNSWGTWNGDDGIYYISYKDTSLNNGYAIQFFMEPEYEDDRIYQYDGTFSGDIFDFDYTTHYEANVYTAQRDEYINRVGFFTYSDAITYKVYIYKGDNVSTNPSSGTLIYEQSTNKSVSTEGFHTVELDNEVLINKGEKFAIVIYMSGSYYNYVDDDYTASWYWTTNSYERGQSFYKAGTSGSWVDASTQKGYWEETPVTLRVKGYTRDDLLVNKTDAYYEEGVGLIIESDLAILINQIDSVKIDGVLYDFVNNNNEFVLIDDEELGDISDDDHTVTIKTKHGFTMTFDDVYISVPYGEKYTLTFDYNGGTGTPANKTVTKDRKYGTLPTPTRTGYTFDGWYTLKEGGNKVDANTIYTLSSNSTIYAHWTIGKYTVTFNENGHGTAPSAKTNVTYNTTITAPTAPTATGYTFDGWYKEASCTNAWNFSNDKVTDNITLYAKWTPYKYTVKFDSNGGSGTMSDESFTYGTAKALTTNAFTRTGYTFNGWNTKADGTGTSYTNGQSVSNLTSINNGTVTLYAKWTVNTYTIKFVNYDGTTLQTSTLSYGATPTYTGNTPTRSATAQYTYTFKGWDKTVSTVTSDATYTATYNQTLNSYTVTFDANGHGTAPNNQTINYGANITKPNNPTATGYTFGGWYKEPSCTNAWNFTTSTVTANTTLYAKWTPNSNTAYKIQHYQQQLNGTYSLAETENKTGTTDTSVSATNKSYTGFTYDSTNTSNVNSGTIAGDGSLVLKLYYKRNSFTVTLNKGTGIASTSGAKTYYYGETVNINATVSTGYTWTKWTSGSSDISTTNNYSFTMPNNAVTYTANAKANTYTVKFDGNGSTSGTMYNQTFTYDVAQNLTTNAYKKTGYTFVGWKDSNGTSYTDGQSVKNLTSTNNATITLTAQWSQVQTYSVIFNTNGHGTAPSSITGLTSGSKISKPTDPTATGYTFGGWYKEPSCTNAWNFTISTVTANTTLYAKWTANTYTVRFNGNGGTPTKSSISVTYNSTYGTLPSASRTNYRFDGWYTATSGGDLITSSTKVAITSDITLYARWSSSSSPLSVTINDAYFVKGNVVEIDGQPYTITKDHEIVLPSESSKIITYFKYNKESTDIHEVYPTNMYVYFISKDSNGNYIATKNSNYEDIMKYSGASIRITGKYGIRIKTSVPVSKRNKLISSNLDGYKLVEYGTIMTLATSLADNEGLILNYDSSTKTYKANHGTYKYAYNKAKAFDSFCEKNDTIIKFTNPLTDFTIDQTTTDFVMRPYMIIRPSNSNNSDDNIVLYGGTLTRDIAYVAYQSRNDDYSANKSAYDYVWEIIRHAYGNKYDADYKKH